MAKTFCQSGSPGVRDFRVKPRGTSVLMVERTLESLMVSSCAMNDSWNFPAPRNPRAFVSSAPAAATFSMPPKALRTAAAVLGPAPFIPGMLSEESPAIAR